VIERQAREAGGFWRQDAGCRSGIDQHAEWSLSIDGDIHEGIPIPEKGPLAVVTSSGARQAMEK
jgi:hypothetical protein